jgi:hypothetical protein
MFSVTGPNANAMGGGRVCDKPKAEYGYNRIEFSTTYLVPSLIFTTYLAPETYLHTKT